MWVSQWCTMEIFYFIKYFHPHPLKLISPVLLFSFLFLPPVLFYTCGDPQLHRTLLFYTLPFHLGSCVTFFSNPFYVLRFGWVQCVLGNFFSFWPKLQGMWWKLTFFWGGTFVRAADKPLKTLISSCCWIVELIFNENCTITSVSYLQY